MSLLAKLKAGKENRKCVNFPGTETQIALHVLSEAQEQEAEFAATSLFQSSSIVIGHHNIDAYQSENTLQKLFLSCRNPDTGDRIAENIAEFKKHLTTAERDLLVEAYNDLVQECNPSPQTMPQDDFDALVDEVKKKPQQTIGSISSISTLKRLALCMAEQLATSPKGSGSTSTQ